MGNINYGNIVLPSTQVLGLEYRGNTTTKELSDEEHLKRVEEFIEKYEVEHDEKYIYLYKVINLDGTDMDKTQNNPIYEVYNTYVVGKVDKNIYNSRGEGLYASTLKTAINSGINKDKTVYGGYTMSFSLNCVTPYPQNPSILYTKPEYKILKVKIDKNHVIVPKENNETIRCSQMFVIEELDLETDALEYKTINLIQLQYNNFKYIVSIRNKYTDKSITIEIEALLDTSQELLKSHINNKLKEMQEIYNQFEKCQGIL